MLCEERRQGRSRIDECQRYGLSCCEECREEHALACPQFRLPGGLPTVSCTLCDLRNQGNNSPIEDCEHCAKPFCERCTNEHLQSCPEPGLLEGTPVSSQLRCSICRILRRNNDLPTATCGSCGTVLRQGCMREHADNCIRMGAAPPRLPVFATAPPLPPMHRQTALGHLFGARR